MAAICIHCPGPTPAGNVSRPRVQCVRCEGPEQLPPAGRATEAVKPRRGWIPICQVVPGTPGRHAIHLAAYELGARATRNVVVVLEECDALLPISRNCG